jgi:putative oxidoreductase
VSTVVSPVPALRAAAGYNVGLLIFRLAAGLTLAVHGSQKLFGWFGGRGVDGTGAFFEQIGYRPGKIFAVVAGLCEFGGGLAFALGVFTPLAASAMIGIMLNAVAADWHKGFLAALSIHC